jgi:hypothetical protein
MRWTIKDEMITSYSISGDGSDAFAFDATEVALGGPDTAPDDGGFVVESDGDGALMQVIQQMQQQQGCEGSEGEATTPGPDDFVAESDAFAYDKLAVDQASADPSDSFIPVEQIRPTESLLPTSDSFLPMESIRPTESLLSWDSGPNGNLSLLGTSDAFAQTDFHLI